MEGTVYLSKELFLLFIMKSITVIAIILFAGYTAKAGIKPNSLFTDHMVLQQGATVPVWGTAGDETEIIVKFNGQVVTAKVINGKWMARLSTMKYSDTPKKMVILGKKDTVTINDILVGEVWLCSGQSNMERQLGPRPPQPLINNWEKERDAATFPLIREFYVPLKYAAEKTDDVNSKWTVCSPQTVSDFSAVGYFFARDLYEHLKIPVGIVFSAYGGTPAEDWTSKAALEGNPELNELAKHYDSIMNAHWHPDGQVMNGLYNGMIYPLIPYAIKGIAWYQGESNNDRANQYAVVLKNMIASWRADFHQGDLPFLIVQVTPHRDMKPELRDAQLQVAKTVKNTSLIVTTDCGDADIHSPYKQPVGQRLALAARNIAYGEKIEYSGPIYKSCKIEGNRVVIFFTHTGKGLVAKDTDFPKGFTICGVDHKFVTALAKIEGDKVVVSSDKVANPTAVRFGWMNIPDVNLFNSEGLPASPFRTDEE